MENYSRLPDKHGTLTQELPPRRGLIPWKLISIYLGFVALWLGLTVIFPGTSPHADARAAAKPLLRDGLFVLLSTGLLFGLLRRYLKDFLPVPGPVGWGETHYRRLIETASEAILVVDLANGRFVQHNSQAERLFEMTGAELAQLGPVALSPEFQPDGQRSSDKARIYLQAAVEGGAPVFDWMHRTRTGRELLCEIRLLRLPVKEARLIRGSIVDITERRQAQEALRQSEQQLALIFNNATDMMALCRVEPGGVFRFVSVNKTYLKAVNAAGFSVKESDLVGRTLQEVNEGVYHFSADYNRGKHARFLTVVSSREVLAYDDVHDAPAGRSFGETVLTPLLDKDGACTFVLYCSRDVTGQRRAAEALARSEDNYRTLFEQATDAIFLCAADGRLLDVNRHTVLLTGFSREDLLEKNMYEAISPEDHGYLRHCLQELLREGTRFSVYRFLCKDGSIFPGETNTKLLPDGRVLAMVRDITERKVAEEQRTKLEMELRQAQKIQAIGTLAGGIAHDFNNILAAILGNAQLLKLTLAPAHEGHNNVSQILVASHRAKDLVQQILMFSRQREQSRQLLKLEPLLREAIKLISVSLPPAIQLNLVVTPELPAVLADPTQIHQVVVNLCTNALHAMRDLGGTLAMSLTVVSLPEQNSRSKPNLPNGRYVCLMVADSGHGMDAATMERMYDPFFTTKPVGEGTGLGLAVVHGIVQSNDGAISVTSEPGKGTVFKLYFPARDARPGTVQPWPVSEIKRGQGEHIVFVDDEVSIAEVAKVMLGKLGYRVTLFTDPRQALEYLQTSREALSLLMTDLSMPGVSGMDLIRAVTLNRPDLPVILLTGYGKAFDSKAATGLNVSEVIHKPFTMEQLSAVIESDLGAKR